MEFPNWEFPITTIEFWVLQINPQSKVSKSVTYYCKVRWLSSATTLERFLNLLTEIDSFMRSKGKEHDEFSDQQRINDIAFLCDITEHMSALNLQLQGKDQHMGILWQRVSAFRSKLQLLKTQLSEGSCPHLKTLEGRVKFYPVSCRSFNGDSHNLTRRKYLSKSSVILSIWTHRMLQTTFSWS